MSSCKLCSDFGPTAIKYDFDSAKQHATTHFLQLNIVDEQVFAGRVFEKCFPGYQHITARRGGSHAKTSSRQILLDLCHSLFPWKRILESPSHVSCAKCGVGLRLVLEKAKQINTTTIISHACSHLDENELYACKHCSQRYKTDGAIRIHLASVHNIRSANGHFEDNVHKFVKEISALIKSCFCPNNKTADLDGQRALTAFRIRKAKRGSELAVERQLLCHQLISKIADRNQMVKCRLCSRRQRVKQTGGFTSHVAMEHVLLHLRKPTKRCRICFETFAYRSAAAHLKTVHSLPLANNYDCLADEYQTEILALLEMCYGSNRDGNRTGVTIGQVFLATLYSSDASRA